MTSSSSTRAKWWDPNDAAQEDIGSAARFVEGFAQAGSGALITNSHSTMRLLIHDDLRLPVTIEDGRIGGTYVASPHSTYVLYGSDEIDIVNLKGAGRAGAKAALGLLDLWLKALSINRTVHIDNWMLSTSLHGNWNGSGLTAIREAVVEQYSEHVPIIRCIDPWSSPDLFTTLERDGWTFLPSRQIWVTDDLENAWKPRSHTKSDRRAMRRSGLTVEELKAMNDADADRLAALYAQLYLDRYSRLNPAYTPAFIKLAFESGALRWRVARNDDGQIMASAGMRIAGDIVTVPMLGYDTTRPQSEALYRIASLLSSEHAMELGLRHHGSAGASVFKRNRGAKGIIEYMAISTKHMSWSRRQGIKALASIMHRTMVPALRTNKW